MTRWIRMGLLLAVAVPRAQSGCESTGDREYYCRSTGDPVADGAALYEFIEKRSYPCGSTILLDAGAEYVNKGEPGVPSHSYGFPLGPQAGCNGAYTTITSTRAGDLPEGKRVLPSDKPKMAKLLTRGTFPAIQFFPKANNWRLAGLVLSNTAAASRNGYIAWVLGASHRFDPVPPGDELSQVVFDRVLVYPYEEEAYGDLANNTNGLAYLRTARTGFYLMGRNVEILNSYIYGLGGYARKGTPVAVTGASSGKPAVLTAPGISASLGVSGTCSGACDESCYGSCARVVIAGAAGDWLTLNGPKYVKYLTADTVAVYSPRRLSGIAGGGEPYSGSGKGPLTGNVSVFGTELLGQYGFLTAWGGPYRIINNHIEAWGMNIFLGGSDTPAVDPAIVQSGSTETRLLLDHVRELKVGDLVVVDVPEGAGRSKYCGSSAKGCWNSNRTRVGKVTAIDGTAVSLAPHGPDGIDVPPRIGGRAAWRGLLIENIEIRRNTIFRNHEHLLAQAGKGPIEVKQAYNGLVDGNIIGTAVNGNYFITSRNQGGRSPWMTTENFTFSNNLVGGPDGSSSRMLMQLEDDEHTNAAGANVTFYNNLQPNVIEIPYAGGISQIADGGGGRTGGWLHNTNTPPMGTRLRAFLHFDCQTSPFVYGVTSDWSIRDNLWGFGEGIVIGRSQDGRSCWPAAKDQIKSNLFVDTRDTGVRTIRGAWPGNTVLSNYGQVKFKGVCAFESWEDCELAEDSPGKGAASDGKDLGADVAQVKDRINGWSEEAGLLVADTSVPAMVNNPEAFQLGAAEAVIRFKVFNAKDGTCSLELYTNGARTKKDPDTDSYDKQACTREGNSLDAGVVTFRAGRYSPLRPGATYHYRIQDGERVMVGEFTMPDAPAPERPGLPPPGPGLPRENLSPEAQRPEAGPRQ
ncbi:MAG: hypothetical protein IT159_16035 [Bryobacterales bacterium]|nr:hypothetical protein [Bryobacterales bacterium]